MFSARMTVSAAMMAVPGSMIITAVTVTNDLVYQTPRADLIILVQKKLKSFGLSQEEIVAFTTNTAIPLSLQVDAVKDLEALGNIPGRRAAAVDLGNMMTEYQARFLVTSLHMLGQWSQQTSPITRIYAPGVLVARDQNRHHDTARTGRLPVMDTAHCWFCDRSPVDGPAQSRSLDHTAK